jgi:RNA polymerase sigma-70 factor (ECF subfamily)
LTLEEEIALIDKSKKNPKFFEPLYNHYFKDIFLFILSRVGDKEVSGDLTSQVFLKALVNLKKYKHMGFRISAWLMKIADNEVKYYFRKTNRMRNVTITNEALENLGQIIEEDNNENLLEALVRLLQNLEEEALQLIELRFFEKKSFQEIGYVLDITENNAKVRTYRLLDKLRNAMSHEKV